MHFFLFPQQHFIFMHSFMQTWFIHISWAAIFIIVIFLLLRCLFRGDRSLVLLWNLKGKRSKKKKKKRFKVPTDLLLHFYGLIQTKMYLCVCFLVTLVIHLHFTFWARVCSIHQIPAGQTEKEWTKCVRMIKGTREEDACTIHISDLISFGCFTQWALSWLVERQPGSE